MRQLPEEREHERWLDRRAVFLFAAGAVSLLLVPLSPDDLDYVGVVLAVWCAVLGIASWLDKWGREH